MGGMKKALAGALTLLLFSLSGCAAPPAAEEHSVTLFAMDTAMEITVYGDEALLEQATALVMDLEGRLSVTDPDSEIAALNQTGCGEVSADTAALLTQALELCARTGGALDISIYPVVRAWGFTTGEYRVPDEQELTGLLQAVDYRQVALEGKTVSLSPAMQIDLGSVAKGWTGDRLLQLFQENGVTSAKLNLGGNVQLLGAKPDGSPWKIGVADPSGSGYAGELEVTDKAVITSGGYERFFEQDGHTYHHIIDPSTGRPADSGLLSVTVVGDTGVVCDALSTSLFVMGLDKAAALWQASGDFEAIFITDDGITVTAGLEECFSPLGNYKNTEVAVLYHA